MTEFVLASCSKSKLEGTHCARDLYEPSAIFRKRRRFARERGDHWGILSAQFGYLRPWDTTPYYEKHISDRTEAWAAFVLDELVADLEYHGVDQVTILAGSGYVDPLVAPLESRGYDVVDLHRGLRPGERMSALDDAVAPGEQTTLATDGGRTAMGDKVVKDD